MLNRENVSITWFGYNYNVFVPISKKITSNCPIVEKLNLDAANYSFNQINYENLKNALSFEFKIREKFIDLVKNNKDADYYSYFELAGINTDSQQGDAHILSNYINCDLIEECKNINHLKKLYLAEEKIKNNIKKFKEYGVSSLFHERSFDKELNLFLILPDQYDHRNILSPRKLEDDEGKFDVMYYLNNICEDYDYSYGLWNRPFEDLTSVVLGRELAMKYLNYLELKL